MNTLGPKSKPNINHDLDALQRQVNSLEQALLDLGVVVRNKGGIVHSAEGKQAGLRFAKWAAKFR